MNGTINIEYPESLANSLKLSDEEFVQEMKASSLVKLYEMRKISSGVAAQVMGISRLDFLELLAKYQVSVFGEQDAASVREDITNA